MSVREQLNQDLRAARRANDEVRKTTIRLLLSAIHNAEIQAHGQLDDPALSGVLNREARQPR